MNRSRVTGDLASHGNIFVDIANDRVGIGSTIPGQKLSLPDSAKIALGNSADLQLYHDTSLSQIVSNNVNNFTIRQQAGSGFMFIHADQLHLRSQSTNEPYFVGTNNGTVQLYYDNSVKFNTAAIGIVVTGTTDTDGLAVSGVSTFTGVIDANAGADISGGVSIGGELNLIGSSDTAKYIDARVGTSNNLNFRSTSGGDSNHVTMMSLNTSGASITGDLTVGDSSDSSSAAGPEFTLNRNSSSPADADYLGQIKFAGRSDTDVQRNYAKITGKILDASNGTEDGIIEFAHIKAGSEVITGRFRSDSLQLLNGTQLTVAGTTTLNSPVTVDTSTDEKLILSGSTAPYIQFREGTTNKAYIQWSGSGYLQLGNEEAGEVLRLADGESGLIWRVGTNNRTVWTSGNDGASSGLDADTVDGLQASSLARSDIEETITGKFTFTSNGSYPIKISGTDDAKIVLKSSSNPFIRFQEGTTDKAYIQWNASGWFQLFNQEDNSGIRIKDDIVFTQDAFSTTHKIWHAGNDGTGSGLDADTLDGVQGSSFLRSDADDSTSGSITFSNDDDGIFLYGGGRFYKKSGSGVFIRLHNANTPLKIENNSGTFLGNVFHSGNDGSGSGLDADTLDGVQGSSFLRSDANDTYSANLTFSQDGQNGFLTTAGGTTFHNVGGSSSKKLVLRNLAELRFQDAADWDYNEWAGIKFVTSTDTMYIGGPASSNFTNNSGAANIDVNFVGLNGSGLKKDGNTVWHAGNDGSGSGLDADTLDGSQASAFPTLSGSNSFTNSYNEFGNSTGSVSNTGSWNARLNLAGSNHARLDVQSVSDGIITTMYAHNGHNAGRVGTYSNHKLILMANAQNRAELSTSGSLSTTVQGTLWGASNDGAGSGLDSDLLDGQHGSYYAPGRSQGVNQNYVASSTSTSNRGTFGQGVWAYQGYSTGTNRPFTYDCTLQVMSNSQTGFEISVDWLSQTKTPMKVRSLRDCCQGWSEYTDIFTSGYSAIPDIDNTVDLGSTSYRWRNIYSQELNVTKASGNLSGTFVASNGLGTLEIGGSTGAFIDLKMPSSDDLDFRIGTSGSGGYLTVLSGQSISVQGHFNPSSNNTYDLGSTSVRWRNLFTNDLNLSNEGGTNDVDGTWGSYTIQEGEDDLFLINKRSGKKYKFNLTEVS